MIDGWHVHSGIDFWKLEPRLRRLVMSTTAKYVLQKMLILHGSDYLAEAQFHLGERQRCSANESSDQPSIPSYTLHRKRRANHINIRK